VIGPGNLIGEMGVLDGAPRSATCTAYTDLAAAVLTRAALLRLVREKPAVAAHLMLAVSKRLSDRLRDTTRKLKQFVQINTALQQEIQAIMHGGPASKPRR
jgi:CRP-like cAMP-binding protein